MAFNASNKNLSVKIYMENVVSKFNPTLTHGSGSIMPLEGSVSRTTTWISSHRYYGMIYIKTDLWVRKNGLVKFQSGEKPQTTCSQ